MKRIFCALAMLLFGQQVSAQAGPNIGALAKELTYPGAVNITLHFKIEYRTFEGELPGADGRDSLTSVFQPVLSVVLHNGNNLISRRAFSYVFGQAIAGSTGFIELSQFGDIPYDLLYS